MIHYRGHFCNQDDIFIAFNYPCYLQQYFVSFSINYQVRHDQIYLFVPRAKKQINKTRLWGCIVVLFVFRCGHFVFCLQICVCGCKFIFIDPFGKYSRLIQFSQQFISKFNI